jgi:hypothetical protein
MSGEWIEVYSDKYQRQYWKNTVTGKSTWSNPFQDDNDNNGNDSNHNNTVTTTNATNDNNINNDDGFNRKKSQRTSEKYRRTDSYSLDAWIENYSEVQNKRFWVNKITSETTWVSPEEYILNLQAETNLQQHEQEQHEWEELYNEKHKRKYWKHKTTGETSWKAPKVDTTTNNDANKAADTKTDVVVESTSSAAAATSSEWEELYNEKHKRKYWKNKMTGETSWKAPKIDVITTNTKIAAQAITAPSSTIDKDWEELYNEKHKRKYWKHKTTGETSWKAPKVDTTSIESSKSTALLTSSSSSNDTNLEISTLKDRNNIRGVIWLSIKNSTNHTEENKPNPSLLRCVFELRGTLKETVIDIYRYCNLKFDNNTPPPSSSSSVLITKNNDKDLVDNNNNLINHSFINHIIISMKNVKTILCNQVCYKFIFMSYVLYNIVYI